MISCDRPSPEPISVAEVEQNQARLQLLIQQNPLAVIEWNTTFEVMDWNPAAARMFGYSKDEALHRSVVGLLVPESVRSQIDQVILALLSNTGGAHSINENITKEGRIIVCEWHNAILTNPQGKVIGIISTVQDVTERERIQQMTIEQESKYRLLVENASDMIYAMTLDGQITYLSPSFERLFGFQPEQWIGESFQPLVHPDDVEICLSCIQQAIETGKPSQFFEFRHLHQDGSWRWGKTSNIPVKDSSGNLTGLQGIIRDISDRKKAEETLWQKETQYRLIFEHVMDGLTILDVDSGSYVLCNPAMAEMHGHSLEVFMTLPPSGYVHPDYLYLFDIMVQKIQQKEPFYAQALDLHKDGYAIDVEVFMTPILYEGKRCALSLVRDITQQQRATQERQLAEAKLRQQASELTQALTELKQAQMQMVQSEKMSSLGQLVAGVAHEINNPVNFIHGNLTPAQEYVDDLLKLVDLYHQNYPQPVEAIDQAIDEMDLDFLRADLTKLLASMRVGTDRIRDIVLSLRNFSRLDEAAFKQANIHEGIDSTLMILDSRLKAKPEAPAIAIHRSYGNLPLVDCYAGQLNQVFMNILVNAIDALEERDQIRTIEAMHQSPSAITITTEIYETDWIQIRIRDNGAGMPESVRERIFDPFFTTKPVGKGTGMGMSISYKIITEKHQGSITCTSVPQKGTEFQIQIPIQLGSSPP